MALRGTLRGRAGVLLQAVMVAAAVTAGPTVRADDFVDRVNKPYANIAKEKRSDLVILPLMIKMQPPPAFLTDAMDAALLPATSPNWAAAAEWSQAAPQQALLDAVKQVTQDEDFRTAMVFAQPYGVEGVAGNFDLISAGLYTELGDPPTLAQAKHLYMPKMRWLEILAQIDATRRLTDGDAKGAVEAMIHWLFFSRQFADRQFLEEKEWAMRSMRLAFERIRDLAYQDFRKQDHGLDASMIIDDIQRLDQNGYIGLERLTIPEGDIVATDQILHRVIKEKDGTIPDLFARNMAQIASGDRPLRLFSEAAYWRNVSSLHAGWYESLDMLNNVADSWRRRWSLDPFDPVLTADSDYKRMLDQGAKFAVIAYMLRGVEALFPLRNAMFAEDAGTRTSLGVYGYHLRFGTPSDPNFPPSLASIRPVFEKELDRDPYSSNPQTLQYFVPIRDTPQGPRGELRPWEVGVFPEGRQPFKVPFRDSSDFIVYSVGLDDVRGFAKYATQADPEAKEGDYLLWPPVISLVRKRLMDTGELN